MKRLIYIIIAVAVLSALVWLKIAFFTSHPELPGTANMKAGNVPVARVSGIILKPEQSGDLIFATGTDLANESLELVPETSGRIIHLNFTEGSRANKGDLLVKIKDAEYTAELAKLNLQLKLAGEREQRIPKLQTIGGTSQEEYDIALNIKQILEAEIDLVKVNISKTELRAPFGGQIGFRNKSAGAYTSPTMKIATFSQTNLVKIDFSIPEKYTEKVKKGDTLHFSIPGNETSFAASVLAIYPYIETSTRTLMIRAICGNPDGKIFPGAFARVELNAGTNGNILQIPTQALIKEFKGQKIFQCKNGKATPVKVEIGRRTESKVEITSGAIAGDTVLTSSIMSIKPGTPVTVNL